MTRPLRHGEIMVVAQYSEQVKCLRETLPAGVPVGTVDKFQGQKAPVVFFSMTTSSGADVPRNVEFLLSRKSPERGDLESALPGLCRGEPEVGGRGVHVDQADADG